MNKKTNQISVRLAPGTMAALREINERHGLLPTEFTRRLIESAIVFYLENGWFGFPVQILPQPAPKVAERTAPYSGRKKPQNG